MKAVILLISVLYCGSSLAESYLCIPEAAAGLRYNELNTKYVAKRFRETGKFIVLKQGKSYYFKRHGKKGRPLACHFQKSFSRSGIQCDLYGAQFRFDAKQLRYVYVSTLSYSKPHDQQDLSMSAGKCSRID